VGKPEGKRPLGKSSYRIVDNITMTLGEICDMEWIDKRSPLVDMVMKLRVSQNAGKFLSNCITGGNSRRVHLYGVN
jgi:hypothetical protein